MGLFDAIRNVLKRAPVYDTERAVVVIFAHLSPEMKQSLDHTDIEKILAFEVRYLDEQGLTRPGSDRGAPPAVEHDALVVYIRKKAEQRLLEYSEEQIEAVLEAEVAYMRQAGIIEDED